MEKILVSFAEALSDNMRIRGHCVMKRERVKQRE